jgi:DHA1 family multidrug resistance protein-like MFS transporter
LQPWRRNFYAVWPSLFATSMGLMAVLPLLPLFVREQYGIDDPAELATWVSLVYGIAPLSAAFAGPVWGALGDRRGKKVMAIRANLAIALTTLLMPWAPNPWVLMAMRCVQGVLAGYVAPSMALVSQDAPRHQHGLVIGMLQVAMAGGSFLGPWIGAEVSLQFGRSSLFFVTSGLSFVAALLLWLFAREAPAKAPAAGSTLWSDFLLASRELLQSRVFVGLLLLVLLLRVGQNMLEPFLALFVTELGPQPWLSAWSETPAHAVERTIALAFAVLAIAQWFMTPLWGHCGDRVGPLRCLSVLALGLGVVLCGTASVTSIDEFLLLRTLAALLMAGSMTLAYAAASKRVADHRRTFAFSLVQSCMQLGFATGPLLGAVVARSGAGPGTDFRLVYVTAGLCCIAAGLGMVWLRRVSPVQAGP